MAETAAAAVSPSSPTVARCSAAAGRPVRSGRSCTRPAVAAAEPRPAGEATLAANARAQGQGGGAAQVVKAPPRDTWRPESLCSVVGVYNGKAVHQVEIG